MECYQLITIILTIFGMLLINCHINLTADAMVTTVNEMQSQL